jgi:ABC-type nitrate/sulfonate/bicarbonate transport system substrate-binding protein
MQKQPTAELEKTRLTLGFIPLNDCAPLVIALEKGFFAAQGLTVELSKETSWANIRDKVAIGVLDGAQMLAPMPLEASLGLGPIGKPMVTAFSFGLNGNAITVSEELHHRMLRIDPAGTQPRPRSADTLRSLLRECKEKGEPPLTFGIVYPFSCHNYQLRYWLAAAGIHPDRDLNLEVVPPSQMVGRLRDGRLDGFCVGEPWNSMAVREGIGWVPITGYEIWNGSPEKVLGVNEEWADQHPQTHRALIRALLQAACWLDAPENRPEAVGILSRSCYVNAPADVIRMSLNGTFQYARTEFPVSLPDFYVFQRFAANFPWRSHALWLLGQMIRWGQVSEPTDIGMVAEKVYRSGLYREVAGELGIVSPSVDYKEEGGHPEPWRPSADAALTLGGDAFLDGGRFTPADIVDYIADTRFHSPLLDRAALGSANPAWDAGRRRRDLLDSAEMLQAAG